MREPSAMMGNAAWSDMCSAVVPSGVSGNALWMQTQRITQQWSILKSYGILNLGVLHGTATSSVHWCVQQTKHWTFPVDKKKTYILCMLNYSKLNFNSMNNILLLKKNNFFHVTLNMASTPLYSSKHTETNINAPVAQPLSPRESAWLFLYICLMPSFIGSLCRGHTVSKPFQLSRGKKRTWFARSWKQNVISEPLCPTLRISNVLWGSAAERHFEWSYNCS